MIRGLAVFCVFSAVFVVSMVCCPVFGGAYEVPPVSANVFKTAKYVDIGTPSFDQSERYLPRPVLDGDKKLLEMYWYCWRLAFTHLKKPKSGSGLASNFLDEAFNRHIFQWDTIFMLMFARYGHAAFPFIVSLDNFYCKQHDDGYICREILEKNGDDFYDSGKDPRAINPPIFSWAEMENFKLTGNKERLAKAMPTLERYVAWLETGRKKEGTKHGLYWNSNLGSGMDNSPRSGSGWVDMSSQMVIQYDNLAEMAGVLGKDAKKRYFRRRAKEISDLMDKWMWNDKDGLYYDVDDDGKQVKRKTIACFWPLLAGTATGERAKRLVANLKDPKTFWRKIVFPTLSADDPKYKVKGGYWHGAVWAPTNMAVIKGLDKAGFHDFAAEASERYLAGMEKVFEATQTVWENYAPDAYKRGEPAKPKFVGWTGCGPIALLIENVIGINCDAFAKRVVWRVRRVDRHGVENLKFGGITASFVALPRKSREVPVEIKVKSDSKFDLVVELHGERSEFHVEEGENSFSVE